MLLFLAGILNPAMLWWQLQTNQFWHLGKNRRILRKPRYQTLTTSLTQILGVFSSCWQRVSGAGSCRGLRGLWGAVEMLHTILEALANEG